MTFGGKAKEGHHPATRAFSMTLAGNVDMRIENFSQSVTECTLGTVFNVDNYIASYDIVNRGTASDRSYIKHLYRTVGETTWHDLEGGVLETGDIAPGASASERVPIFETWACPASGTAIEFCIKVWGKNTESEPPNP